VRFQSENLINKVKLFAIYETNAYVFVRQLHQNIAWLALQCIFTNLISSLFQFVKAMSDSKIILLKYLAFPSDVSFYLFIYLFYLTANDDTPEPGMPSSSTSCNTKIWWQMLKQ